MRDAIIFTRALALFLESKIDSLDYREALLDNVRARAIVDILWQFMSLPFNSLDCEFTFWLKRIYYFLYGNGVPSCIIKKLSELGIKPEIIVEDELWN